MQSLRQLEMRSDYYSEMIEGLSVFEKIERNFEEIDFLLKQKNVLFAAELVRKQTDLLR